MYYTYHQAAKQQAICTVATILYLCCFSSSSFCECWTPGWTADWTVDWAQDSTDQSSCRQTANATKVAMSCLCSCFIACVGAFPQFWSRLCANLMSLSHNGR